MIRVESVCGECLKRTPLPLSGADKLRCRRCGGEREVRPSATLLERKVVDVCALCGCGYLYVEKDFPAWMGLGVMIAGVAGFLLLAERNIALALGVLMGVAALDGLLYRFVPFRTVCYRCLATYRGAVRNPEHRTYELGTAGRFTDDYEAVRKRKGAER